MLYFIFYLAEFVEVTVGALDHPIDFVFSSSSTGSRAIQLATFGRAEPVFAFSSSSIWRKALDSLSNLNQPTFDEIADPEIITRIAQYEMAYRMQTSVPETMSINDEPAHIHEMYGSEPRKARFCK